MSKSGLYAHFGSKQELQLANVDEAERILQAEVVQPALAARPGLAQLSAVCEAYFSYVQRRPPTTTGPSRPSQQQAWESR
jgi:AcrR family transcriptional regulator